MNDAFNSPSRSRLNWVLMAALAGLMAFGLAFVLSATRVNELFSEAAWYKQPFFKMIVFYVIGIGVAVVVCLKD